MRSPAKKIMYGIAEVIIVLLLAYASIAMYSKARGEQAKSIIVDAIRLLGEYHEINGRFPESLDDLPGLEGSKERILVVFPPPVVRYYKRNDGYQIDYYEFPLGPSHGYDSKSGEWYYRE